MKPSHSGKIFFSNLFSYPSRISYMCIIHCVPLLGHYPVIPTKPLFTKSLLHPHTFSCVFWFGFGGSLRVVGEEGERRTENTKFSWYHFHEHAYEILHWTLWSQLSRAYTIEENVSLSSKQPLQTHRTQEKGGLQESGLDLRCSIEGLTLCRCCVDSHGCTESLTTCHAWAFLTVHPSSS